MDSTGNLQRIKSYVLSILGILSITFLMIGCPDPEMRIKFQRGSKRVKVLKVPVFEDVLEVRMSGISYFSDIDDFYLGFSVKAICYSNNDSLEIYPDSLEGWFCQSRLDSLKGKLDDISADNQKRIYECEFHIEFNSRKSMIELIKNDQLESNFLKFYIGNMIYFNGKKVDIDTIYAYDPKAKRFKDYTNY